MIGSSNDDGNLGLAVDRLVAALDPLVIYLFGSRARGDHGSDSDYDLLVVVESASEPGHVRDRRALRALRGTGMPAEVMVLTREEFERQRPVETSLVRTVEREGVILYAA